MIVIQSVEELESVIGLPTRRAADKVRSELAEVDLAWLATASLMFMATADSNGNLDVSPKGDPAGFVKVLDATTIAIPDRPGNRRVDGFHNLLADPHIGLIFLIPGRGDTLRINGRAKLVRDGDFFDDMIVRGNRPDLAVLVEIDEVFFHCSKAFLRSKAWDPDAWRPDAAPRRAVIAHAVERPDDSIEDLDAYYDTRSYSDGLYGPISS
jgi:PPOX class probable FMN-dependent enzyme